MNDTIDFLQFVTPELERMVIAQTPNRKKRVPVAAYFNGKPIRTGSGKSVWSGIGPAKNALILHFSSYEYAYQTNNPQFSPFGKDYSIPRLPWDEQKKRRDEFRKRLWDVIEFREI